MSFNCLGPSLNFEVNEPQSMKKKLAYRQYILSKVRFCVFWKGIDSKFKHWKGIFGKALIQHLNIK